MTETVGNCIVCGNEFTKTVNHHKCCSKDCKRKHKNQLERKRRTIKPKSPSQNPEYRRQWKLKHQERYMFYAARDRAKKRGLDFNISIDDISLPVVCPVLGIQIEVCSCTKPRVIKHSSPSLDRIDNTKGYIKGNVRVISNRANTLKNDATFEELEKIYTDAKQIKELTT